jgi:hypothetical protein
MYHGYGGWGAFVSAQSLGADLPGHSGVWFLRIFQSIPNT